MTYTVEDERARALVAKAESLLATLEPEIEDLERGMRLTLAARGVPQGGIENVMLALESRERLGYVKGQLATAKAVRKAVRIL